MQHDTSWYRRYLNHLAIGAEAWTAQGVSIALTGGYEPHQNQTFLKGWPDRPITDLGEFWRQADEVTFEVRGIAAIHGVGFGTFALDMDGEAGRADFHWLEHHGYIRPRDIVMESPNGFHVITQHSTLLAGGHLRHPRDDHGSIDRRQIVVPDLKGPRHDGTLHVTPRGMHGAAVTKLPPTVRPITGEPYTARHGWRWEPLPLWDWFSVHRYEIRDAEPLELHGDGTAYGRAALVGEVERVLGASIGSRNDQLYASAYKLGRLIAIGILAADIVEHCLLRACEENGYVEDEGTRTAVATCRSGLERGISHPREVA